MLEHIERLKAWQALGLPAGIERQVHQNRLLKIAREGGQMTPADLAKFEPQRRYATLVALAIEGMATVTDEIIDLHDRIIGKLFNAAKNKHQQQFQASGKAINDKVRLYGRIGQALIEAVMPWDTFAASVTEAQTLAQPADFDKIEYTNSFVELQADPIFSGCFTSMAPLITYVDTNVMHLRRMAVIKQKAHYVNPAYMQRLREENGLEGWNIAFAPDGRIIATADTMRVIMQVLLNHRLYSKLSLTTFDVPSSSAV